jgi:hypothetical protein
VEDRQRYAKALDLTRQHDKLIDEAVRWESWKDDDGEVNKIGREKADDLRAQAGDIVRHLNTYYSDMAGEPGTGTFVGAPAPQRPGRVTPTAAAPAPRGGAKFDEATVRSRATAAGRDPDAAVRAARAQGLIK